MNGSGKAVSACLRYFKIGASRLIVVVDDVALPLGTTRLRESGSSGGHNGLRSVEEYLRTQEYFRFRVGIGNDKGQPLADYVLGKFTAEERRALPEILEKGASALEDWLKENR